MERALEREGEDEEADLEYRENCSEEEAHISGILKVCVAGTLMTDHSLFASISLGPDTRRVPTDLSSHPP